MAMNAARVAAGDRDAVARWECHCQRPPVLLGTYDGAGRINIKMRDRYWHVIGRIWTHCPRCGAEHFLDPAQTAGVATLNDHAIESSDSSFR